MGRYVEAVNIPLSRASYLLLLNSEGNGFLELSGLTTCPSPALPAYPTHSCRRSVSMVNTLNLDNNRELT